jgi:predicted GIY-YIG superfamily endonuclease
MDTRLHCVYLLTSQDPALDGHYCYIGYTVNPLRRLRQHNGELVAGAKRTARKGRPWGIVCFVSGFSEDRSGLKFEWCWQHPTDSTLLKTRAEALRGLSVPRLSYYLGILMLLLTSDLFKSMPLKLHILDSERYDRAYAALSARMTLKPSFTTAPLANPYIGALMDESSRGHSNSTRGQPRLLEVPSFNSLSVGPLQMVRMSVEEVKVWLRSQNAGGEGVGGREGSDTDAEWENISDVSGADEYQPTQRPGGSPATPVRGATYADHSGISSEASVPLWDPAVRRQLEGAGLLACTLCGGPVTSDIGVCCPRYITSSTQFNMQSPLVSATDQVGVGVMVPSRNDASWERACTFLAHIPCANLWFNHSHQFHRALNRTQGMEQGQESEPARIVPTRPVTCPVCRTEELHWSQLIQDLKNRVKRRLIGATTAAASVGKVGARGTGRGRGTGPGSTQDHTRKRTRANAGEGVDRGEDAPLQLSRPPNSLSVNGASLPLGQAAPPPFSQTRPKSNSASSDEWMNLA